MSYRYNKYHNVNINVDITQDGDLDELEEYLEDIDNELAQSYRIEHLENVYWNIKEWAEKNYLPFFLNTYSMTMFLEMFQ